MWAVIKKGPIDSECSRYMTKYISELNGFREVKGPKVAFRDNSQVVTKGKGTVRKENVKIIDVSFVKGLKYNRLSIS